MTTPTREQVNKLLEMIQRHFPSLPLDERYTNWKQWSEFAQAAFSFGADEARSDLEATIAEQATEISKLIAAVADHVTVRSEQRQTIIDQGAEIERMKHSEAVMKAYYEQIFQDGGKRIVELRQQLARRLWLGVRDL